MKSFVIKLILAFVFTVNASAANTAPESNPKTNGAALMFGDREYLHRWSKDDQHEYTPTGQEDLGRWADMVTINRYRSVTTGEGLAVTANAVLEAYKSNRAIVVRTDSVARTSDKPAEYLMIVLFPRPDFIEAVFARFKMAGGVGTATIYSHREYGKKIGDLMSAWLKANGPTTEKTLMSWEGIPLSDKAKK